MSVVEKGSPTLRGGQRYLSITAPIPVALSDRIRAFQRRWGVEDSGIHSHITLLICRDPQRSETLGVLDSLLRTQPSFQLELGEPASFSPLSQVTYLGIATGAEELEKLHMLCRQQVGESVSPFPYIPHLTLAMRLPEEALRQSLEEFRSAGKETGSFTVDRLEVFSFDGRQWAHLRHMQLGPLSRA